MPDAAKTTFEEAKARITGSLANVPRKPMKRALPSNRAETPPVRGKAAAQTKAVAAKNGRPRNFK